MTRRFREGQIVKHKISGEEFVLIKYRCLLFRLFELTTKEVVYVSKGMFESDYYNFYEDELRTLTDNEIKKREERNENLFK